MGARAVTWTISDTTTAATPLSLRYTAPQEPSAAASVGATEGSACAGDGGSEGGGDEPGRGEWKWGGVEGEIQWER